MKNYALNSFMTEADIRKSMAWFLYDKGSVMKGLNRQLWSYSVLIQTVMKLLGVL